MVFTLVIVFIITLGVLAIIVLKEIDNSRRPYIDSNRLGPDEVWIKCPSCDGQGTCWLHFGSIWYGATKSNASYSRVCIRCNGTGKIKAKIQLGPNMEIRKCRSCAGRGECMATNYSFHPCRRCDGRGTEFVNVKRLSMLISNARPVFNKDICISCSGYCVNECLHKCIGINEEGVAVLIRPEDCNGCGDCADACVFGAISMEHDYKLTAKQLYFEYWDNKATADEKYKDQRIELTGRVIDMQSQSLPYIELVRSESGYAGVRAYCSDDYDFALLSKGQTVTIEGKCVGLEVCNNQVYICLYHCIPK